jgi:hypothetical protein
MDVFDVYHDWDHPAYRVRATSIASIRCPPESQTNSTRLEARGSGCVDMILPSAWRWYPVRLRVRAGAGRGRRGAGQADRAVGYLEIFVTTSRP